MKMTGREWIEYSIKREYAIFENKKLTKIENKIVAKLILSGESLSAIKEKSIYPNSVLTVVYLVSKFIMKLLDLYVYIRKKFKRR